MTMFTCDRCGKVDELDKALVYITDDGKQTYICEGCDSKAGFPSENTCVCCGEVIPEGRQVCAICETKNTGEAIARGMLEGITKKDTHVDIHKIIDDAMEKRDRTVSIFISAENNAVSVNVYPMDYDKAKWIYREDDEYEYKYRFECSNCGMTSEFQTAYCSCCGEQMHGVRRVDT